MKKEKAYRDKLEEAIRTGYTILKMAERVN